MNNERQKRRETFARRAHPYQHVAVLHVEVEEEEEGDEEAEEGDGGALPQAPHLVQGFPQQPHAAAALSGTCRGTGTEKLKLRRRSASRLALVTAQDFFLSPVG